ncbi:dihydropteroate synthase [Candidatus Omnitrophota bacterium]
MKARSGNFSGLRRKRTKAEKRVPMLTDTKDISLSKYKLPVGERTCIMGILNVTPDSFSDGDSYLDPERALKKVLRMVECGADIIDIGGESTRPGAERISAEEELLRVMPIIKALEGKISIPLSIDTYKSRVAREALEEGVSIVNDITALRGDQDMARTVAEFDAGLILMHMKGDPSDMQDDPRYEDVMSEICSCLSGAISMAQEAGIDTEKIMVDPGIGFGKTLEHNLIILRDLSELRKLGKPVLAGTSRKSFIGSLTGRETPDRIFGTAASIAVAIMSGADIIRVHDVDEMRDVARVVDAIKRA